MQNITPNVCLIFPPALHEVSAVNYEKKVFLSFFVFVFKEKKASLDQPEKRAWLERLVLKDHVAHPVTLEKTDLKDQLDHKDKRGR